MIDVIIISVAIVAVITLVSMLTSSNVNNDNTSLVYPEKNIRYFHYIRVYEYDCFGNVTKCRYFDKGCMAAAIEYFSGCKAHAAVYAATDTFRGAYRIDEKKSLALSK